MRTGMPFNSGLAVELTKGAPENPLVNAGAMSTVSLIEAKDKPIVGTKSSTT
jgi:glutaminase